MMDLAVPRRPLIAIPPSSGSTPPSSSADLICAWPTTAERGKAVRTPAGTAKSPPSSASSAARTRASTASRSGVAATWAPAALARAPRRATARGMRPRCC